MDWSQAWLLDLDGQRNTRMTAPTTTTTTNDALLSGQGIPVELR